MKFKFIGKPTILVNTLTTNKIYKILHLEHYSKYFCAYVVDNENQVICIPYRTMELFNENWSCVDND